MYYVHYPSYTVPVPAPIPMPLPLSVPVREALRQNLALHETLELHELLASKNTDLYNQKKALAHITDSELKQIYTESIRLCESQIRELVGLLQNRE